eukprot:TRINITY_DN24547_c0_g1_i5.p1 TRINITY_DN24547_c0_g1~~TRINITY_DN24547_c0_g1_i5.p1  ORF type:complete len:1340 (-),score=142.00 TRINITY_DN24547_c0_g1_i5:15-4034(-)
MRVEFNACTMPYCRLWFWIGALTLVLLASADDVNLLGALLESDASKARNSKLGFEFWEAGKECAPAPETPRGEADADAHDLGKHDSLQDCSDACASASSLGERCNYFAFGKDEMQGRCFWYPDKVCTQGVLTAAPYDVFRRRAADASPSSTAVTTPRPEATTTSRLSIGEHGVCHVCTLYMQQVGCYWTEEYPCPGQPSTDKYRWDAKDDGEHGYDNSDGFYCCCKHELWKRPDFGNCTGREAGNLKNLDRTNRLKRRCCTEFRKDIVVDGYVLLDLALVLLLVYCFYFVCKLPWRLLGRQSATADAVPLSESRRLLEAEDDGCRGEVDGLWRMLGYGHHDFGMVEFSLGSEGDERRQPTILFGFSSRRLPQLTESKSFSGRWPGIDFRGIECHNSGDGIIWQDGDPLSAYATVLKRSVYPGSTFQLLLTGHGGFVILHDGHLLYEFSSRGREDRLFFHVYVQDAARNPETRAVFHVDFKEGVPFCRWVGIRAQALCSLCCYLGPALEACLEATVGLLFRRTGTAMADGHTDCILDVVHMPEYGLILTASRDGSMKFWDARVGKCCFTLTTGRPVHNLLGDRVDVSPASFNSISCWPVRAREATIPHCIVAAGRGNGMLDLFTVLRPSDDRPEVCDRVLHMLSVEHCSSSASSFEDADTSSYVGSLQYDIWGSKLYSSGGPLIKAWCMRNVNRGDSKALEDLLQGSPGTIAAQLPIRPEDMCVLWTLELEARQLSVSPSGTYLAVACKGDGAIRLFDVADPPGKEKEPVHLVTLPCGDWHATSVALTDEQLYWGDVVGHAHTLTMAALGQMLNARGQGDREVAAHAGALPGASSSSAVSPSALAISPGSSASTGLNESMRSAGELAGIINFRGHGQSAVWRCLPLRHRGHQYFVTCGGDHNVKIFDDAANVVCTLSFHMSAVTSISFCHEFEKSILGMYDEDKVAARYGLYTASLDGKAARWDLAYILQRHEEVLDRKAQKHTGTCSNCGNVLMADSKFCRKCGTQPPVAAPPMHQIATLPQQEFRSARLDEVLTVPLTWSWSLLLLMCSAAFGFAGVYSRLIRPYVPFWYLYWSSVVLAYLTIFMLIVDIHGMIVLQVVTRQAVVDFKQNPQRQRQVRRRERWIRIYRRCLFVLTQILWLPVFQTLLAVHNCIYPSDMGWRGVSFERLVLAVDPSIVCHSSFPEAFDLRLPVKGAFNVMFWNAHNVVLLMLYVLVCVPMLLSLGDVRLLAMPSPLWSGCRAACERINPCRWWGPGRRTYPRYTGTFARHTVASGFDYVLTCAKLGLPLLELCHFLSDQIVIIARFLVGCVLLLVLVAAQPVQMRATRAMTGAASSRRC